MHFQILAFLYRILSISLFIATSRTLTNMNNEIKPFQNDINLAGVIAPLKSSIYEISMQTTEYLSHDRPDNSIIIIMLDSNIHFIFFFSAHSMSLELDLR